MDFDMNARLKQVRKALDLTQSEFAEKIGANRSLIVNYETKRTSPGKQTVYLVGKFYNVNHRWLMTGEGEMYSGDTETQEINMAVERAFTSGSDFEKTVLRKLLSCPPETWKKAEDDLRGLLAEIDANKKGGAI